MHPLEPHPGVSHTVHVLPTDVQHAVESQVSEEFTGARLAYTTAAFKPSLCKRGKSLNPQTHRNRIKIGHTNLITYLTPRNSET
jgi:hypothetical protein